MTKPIFPNDPQLRAPLVVGYVYGALHPEAGILRTDQKLSELLVDSLDYLEFFLELETFDERAKYTDNEVADMKDWTVGQFLDDVAKKFS